MANGDALRFYLLPGPDSFGDALNQVEEKVQDVRSSVAQVANDTAGIMAQAATQDTGELARQMRVIEKKIDGLTQTYHLGSTALNRSAREYAYFEHMRHEGSSFFDQGQQYANDALFEGAARIINSLR